MILRALCQVLGAKPDRLLIDAQTDGDDDTVTAIYNEAVLKDQEREIQEAVARQLAKHGFR